MIRKGEESRISLVFDENGWDVIVDFTTDLEYLIDPIVEPFLPWNKPGSKEPGYTIIPLPSPEQLEKGDPEAHNAVDRFFTVMEKTFG